MPSTPAEILDELIKLAQTLPTELAEYAHLSAHKRRRVRVELESVILRLNTVVQTLDLVRQPKHVFDPASPRVIGDMVARTLVVQEKEPLSQAVLHSFYGAGVYAIYYHGHRPEYAPISGTDNPIYVGKADPAALHAVTSQAQGARLFRRLQDHFRSITSANNLNISDFDCRYLVVHSTWVGTAEDLLIGEFKPVWNNEMAVCYGFGKHGDSADTRSNERSPWDTIHPGRGWATSENNKPNKKSPQQILADIAAHFAKHPPKT